MYLDDVQVRLTVLYAVRCCKVSVSEDMFQELIVYQNVMDYFTMMNCVYELEKMKMVKSMVIDNETRFDITKKGLSSVLMFKDKIPLSIRDKIYDKAYELNQRAARGREISADIVPIDEKRYMTKCGIYEWGTPLLEVSVFAGGKKNAQDIVKRFEKEASSVYKLILEKIAEEGK